MITEVTTSPTSEPVSLDEAKLHLRVDDDAADIYILGKIRAAREECEDITRRKIMPQTITGYLDGFQDEIELPFPPIISVDSITYVDKDGATQTLDPSIYTADLPGRRVLLSHGQSWPSVRNQRNSVTIVYKAGYLSVPEKVKEAVLLLVGEMFAHREETSSSSVSKNRITAENLLSPYRDLRW